jgi:hypothetical protein
VLLRRGIVDEPGLARLLARQWALPFIPDEALAGSFAPSTRLSNEQARALGAYAVTADDGTTWIVLADPHAERLRRLEAMRSAGMPLAIVTATALSQLVNAATLEPATESVATGPTATGTAPRQGPEAVTVAALLEQIMAPLSAAVEASRQETALAEARENELDELANQLAEITEALAQERARSASLEQSLRTHDQQHAAIRAKFEELETLLSSG